MLSTYRDQDWNGAATAMNEAKDKVESMSGKGLVHELPRFYALYAERIEEYKQDPLPEEWDGVFVATSK